jgi:hypothetical protein
MALTFLAVINYRLVIQWLYSNKGFAELYGCGGGDDGV